MAPDKVGSDKTGAAPRSKISWSLFPDIGPKGMSLESISSPSIQIFMIVFSSIVKIRCPWNPFNTFVVTSAIGGVSNSNNGQDLHEINLVVECQKQWKEGQFIIGSPNWKSFVYIVLVWEIFIHISTLITAESPRIPLGTWAEGWEVKLP
jgi:hypothetical protein